MIFGTTIAPGQTTRTATIQRQADNAVFRIEILGEQGSNVTTTKVYHKSAEDTAWTLKGTFVTNDYYLELSGLDEEVCLQFSMPSETIAVNEPFPFDVTPSVARVRVLPPQWFNSAVV